MKRTILKIMILLTLFGQFYHALGLCTHHHDDEIGVTSCQCSCEKDNHHEHGSDEICSSQPVPAKKMPHSPHSNPCDTCICSADSSVMLLSRVNLVDLVSLPDAPAILSDLLTPERCFFSSCVRENLPDTLPIYLAHRSLLI